MRKPGRVLRERLGEDKILLAPGAHDVLTARIIEKVGFDAFYLTGYGSSASLLGKPDVGLLTMTEMAQRVANMAGAVDIPFIADGDTGYGNAINVMRTVRMYEKAGAACIQLEDQVAPKKCGHMMGREIIPREEMVGKIRAAVDARRDPEGMLIMARTDARTSHSLEEGLERGATYGEAGADIIFIESVESVQEMERVTSTFEAPTLANMLEHGRTPLLSAKELEEIGYDLVIFCVSSTYAAAKAVWDLMTELEKEGTTAGMLDRMMAFHEFNQLMGLPQIRKLEEIYATGRTTQPEEN
jgi:carboxyvinyl-carboxyphosphonate phosphorylmutase